MRILLLTASYHPVLGGLQTVTGQLAAGLQQRGHELLIVTNRYPRSLPEEELVDGIPVRRWMFLWPKRTYWQDGRPDLGLASLIYGPVIWQRLRHLLAEWQPDVINMHFPDTQIPFLLRERKNLKGQLVVSLHGDEIERYKPDDNSQGAGDLRVLLDNAGAITACSSYLLQQANLVAPGIDRKGWVIYNGFDPARFDDAQPYEYGRPFILAYGRFTHKKGFDLLLKAWAKIANFYPDIDLVLAGDGEEKDSLQRLARRLEIADRVCFFGRAAPDEVASLLAGCAFVVVPSRQEPFGIVALEALASGRRVLAADVGGLPEMLQHAADPSAYKLVFPGEEELAAGLQHMLTAPTCNVDVNLGGFTWDRVTDRYEQLLEETNRNR